MNYEQMKNMTQNERIIQYIKDFGSITKLDAMRDIAVACLPSRIFELRQEGYNIVTKTETKKNRYGIPTTYGRYEFGDAVKENEDGQYEVAL